MDLAWDGTELRVSYMSPFRCCGLKQINQYLESVGERKARYGVILANPEQSKHLETAQMHIWNMSVDFVNLRSESYTEDSRIPDVAFGTPLEDAMRRDLTINSLFYNINQG